MSRASLSSLLSTVVVSIGLMLAGQQSAAAPQAVSSDTAHPSVEPQAPNQITKAPTAMAAEIVVKFKDEASVKPTIDLFWKDADAAKASFDQFKKNHPAVATAMLARVTYSGELILIFPSNARTPAERLKAARDIAARLSASPEISYAEPDLSFYTGSQP